MHPQEAVKERVVPYLPQNTKVTPLITEIKERRGGFLLNLDRMLLHSENLAKGWNSFFGSLRKGMTLIEPKTRELAICYVGILNQADYEVYQHLPEYLKEGGFHSELDDMRNQDKDGFTL